MRKLTSSDLKELKLLKHYRIIRKWACKTNNLNDADLELLIYLDAIDFFTKDDFKKGTYSFSWDNRGGLQCGEKETTQLKNIIYIKFHLSANS